MSKLNIFTLLSIPGVALVSSSGFATQYLTVEQAQKIIFGNATQMLKIPLKINSEQKNQIEKTTGIRVRKNDLEVWRVLSGKKLIGYFLVDEVLGKHEYITYAVGVDLKMTVLSIEILDYRETYGDQIKEQEWRKQFVGKKLGDSLVLDEGIKNISGATLSCRHIADGVLRVLKTLTLLSNEITNAKI